MTATSPSPDTTISLDPLLRYRSIMDDWAAFADASRTPEPPSLRIRHGLDGAEEVPARLEAQGFELDPVPGLTGVYRVLHAPESPAQTLEHWLGHFHLQQSVMALPSLALDPQPGERVLDLCAAPGGKTTHLAQLMGDRGIVVAVDPKEKRLRGLMSNSFRLLHPNVLVVAADGRSLPGGASFDRALVDAPCSAEGNFRRQSGRLPPRRPEFDFYVRNLQEALLRRAIDLVRPGGRIVYSTCTFAPEENEAVVARVLADCPVEVEAIDDLHVPHAPGVVHWNGEDYPEALRHAWRVYPHHMDSGGAFMVRLRRTDGGSGRTHGGNSRARPDTQVQNAPSTRGWTAIPLGFPGEDPDEVESRQEAIDQACRRFGLFESTPEPHWMIRGDRAWACTAREWPIKAWMDDDPDGRWRVVSMGLRAWRQSPRGRETPSSDLLARWGHEMTPSRVIEPDPEVLVRLLEGERVPLPPREPGPVLLTFRGYRLGRGMVGRGGLRSEIPSSIAGRLAAVLGGS